MSLRNTKFHHGAAHGSRSVVNHSFVRVYGTGAILSTAPNSIDIIKFVMYYHFFSNIFYFKMLFNHQGVCDLPLLGPGTTT
jgi:hypothetical protein